ncbi:MAG: histidine phosphatase family protein [Chitinophagales bacterium]|nr:histidine phosphatase family protein [Chitinophagales bacterium]
MSKYIYLIRHGQTDYNLEGIVQGKGIDSVLNETGKKQALLFFEKYKNIHFDAVYTSTLKRTNQTVAPFIKMGLKHEMRKSLDEINWGIFEGVKHDAILDSKYKAIMQSWADGNLTNRVENGDSPLDLQAKQIPLIEELRKGNFANILLCSHGRAIRALLCGFLDLPLSDMDQFVHQNTCLYKLSLQDKTFHLELRNDVSHLSEKVEDILV